MGRPGEPAIINTGSNSVKAALSDIIKKNEFKTFGDLSEAAMGVNDTLILIQKSDDQDTANHAIQVLIAQCRQLKNATDRVSSLENEIENRISQAKHQL